MTAVRPNHSCGPRPRGFVVRTPVLLSSVFHLRSSALKVCLRASLGQNPCPAFVGFLVRPIIGFCGSALPSVLCDVPRAILRPQSVVRRLRSVVSFHRRRPCLATQFCETNPSHNQWKLCIHIVSHIFSTCLPHKTNPSQLSVCQLFCILPWCFHLLDLPLSAFQLGPLLTPA